MASADRARILTPPSMRARQELADEALDILFYLDIGMELLSYFSNGTTRTPSSDDLGPWGDVRDPSNRLLFIK